VVANFSVLYGTIPNSDYNPTINLYIDASLSTSYSSLDYTCKKSTSVIANLSLPFYECDFLNTEILGGVYGMQFLWENTLKGSQSSGGCVTQIGEVIVQGTKVTATSSSANGALIAAIVMPIVLVVAFVGGLFYMRSKNIEKRRRALLLRSSMYTEM
jgi:hypothetical protein